MGLPVLFSYWHRWAIFHLYRFSGTAQVTMSSRKDAGELGFRILVRHGYRTLRGSSGIWGSRGWKDRGGREALQEMVKAVIDKKSDAGLTVDGPHGPPLKVKRGILLLSHATGAPIVPMAVASRPRLVLSTWDRMHVPLPYSKVVYLFGDPLWVPRDDGVELDALQRELQRRMMDLTERASTWFSKR